MPGSSGGRSSPLYCTRMYLSAIFQDMSRLRYCRSMVLVTLRKMRTLAWYTSGWLTQQRPCTPRSSWPKRRSLPVRGCPFQGWNFVVPECWPRPCIMSRRSSEYLCLLCMHGLTAPLLWTVWLGTLEGSIPMWETASPRSSTECPMTDGTTSPVLTIQPTALHEVSYHHNYWSTSSGGEALIG